MPVRVVFIDDEPDICEMFSDNFATEDVEIQSFTDPVLALSSIRTSPPDLIFVDYRLPLMTGDDLARKLDSDIPVILLTGDLDAKTTYSFLLKLSKQPFPWTQVEAILHSFCVKQGK